MVLVGLYDGLCELDRLGDFVDVDDPDSVAVAELDPDWDELGEKACDGVPDALGDPDCDEVTVTL